MLRSSAPFYLVFDFLLGWRDEDLGKLQLKQTRRLLIRKQEQEREGPGQHCPLHDCFPAAHEPRKQTFHQAVVGCLQTSSFSLLNEHWSKSPQGSAPIHSLTRYSLSPCMSGTTTGTSKLKKLLCFMRHMDYWRRGGAVNEHKLTVQ